MSVSPKTRRKNDLEWCATFMAQTEGGEVEHWIDKLTPLGTPWDEKVLTKYGFKLAKEYNYTSKSGDLLYKSCRYEHKSVPGAKTFIQRSEDPDTREWLFGAGKVRVPYRWPFLDADKTAAVHLCEGEKDADRLASLGLCSTTVAGGQNISDIVVEALRGRDVVILQDNDDVGRELALSRAEALQGAARSIRVVLLPDLPHKGDVSDWLDAGHTKEEYLEFVASAPPWGVLLPLININNWDNEDVPQQEWAVPDRIPLGFTTMLSGEGAAGKSLIMLTLSVAHVLGVPWLGTAPRQGPAIFVDAEDDANIIHKRLADILLHHQSKFADVKEHLHLVSLIGEDAVLGSLSRRSYKIEPTRLYHKLLEMAGDIKPAMITIASSANVFAGNEIDRSQVQQFVAMLTRIARVANGGLVLISHPSLTGIATDTGLSGTTQWHNAVRARAFLKSVKAVRVDDNGEPGDTNLRTLEFRKNNYGPVSEAIPLRYQNGLFLPVAQSEADREARDQMADEVFLTVMKKLLDQGQDLMEANNSKNSASTKIFEHPSARPFSKRDMEAAKQRLLDADKIHIAKTDGPPTKAKKILRLGPRPPGSAPEEEPF
jgi:RecA-family ATPase